jgi:hypothetical protein
MDETAPAEKGERLSRAQRTLLEALATGPQAKVDRFGSSARALYLAGYAEWDGDASLDRRLWWLQITPAGRDALRHDR